MRDFLPVSTRYAIGRKAKRVHAANQVLSTGNRPFVEINTGDSCVVVSELRRCIDGSNGDNPREDKDTGHVSIMASRQRCPTDAYAGQRRCLALSKTPPGPTTSHSGLEPTVFTSP